MSKKDFELIAAVLDLYLSIPAATRKGLALRFADALSGQASGRFDRARFLRACGVVDA